MWSHSWFLFEEELKIPLSDSKVHALSSSFNLAIPRLTQTDSWNSKWISVEGQVFRLADLAFIQHMEIRRPGWVMGFHPHSAYHSVSFPSFLFHPHCFLRVPVTFLSHSRFASLNIFSLLCCLSREHLLGTVLPSLLLVLS